MKPVLSKRLVVSTALITCSACANETASTALLATDSAGVIVRVIEDGTRRHAYQLSDPDWVVGGVDATPDAELFGVVGAVMLSGGDVVIANGGTKELKLFDASGAHRRTVGGEGEGPSEFEGIDLVGRLAGDSILVFDWSSSRLQVFDRALDLARVTLVPISESLGPAGVNPVSVFPDGRFLARGAAMVQEYPREALQRHVFLMDPMGRVVDSVGPVAGGRRIWMSGEPWPPFERNAAFSVHAGSIYTSTSESDEFRRLSLDGDVLEIVRGGLESRAPTREDIEAASRAGFPTGSGDPWISELLPFWSEFFVDGTGATWRSRYPEAAATELEWLIVESGGERIGTLKTPVRFKPLQVARDWVLALDRDSLDVERVAHYRLHR